MILAICVVAIPVAAVAAAAGIFAYKGLGFRRFLGFTYDKEADVFCSAHRNWQTRFGYSRDYDEACIDLSMVLESEPVYFHYDGYDWLIELWKGQYGITCGGELGIYYRRASRKGAAKNPAKLHYKRLHGSEMLPLSMSIWTKKGERLFYREEIERWLNGFKAGVCNAPEELIMYAGITFAEDGMRHAFLAALEELGYTPAEVHEDCETVRIMFDIPKSIQPKSNTNLAIWREMRFLGALTDEFNADLAEIGDLERAVKRYL